MSVDGSSLLGDVGNCLVAKGLLLLLVVPVELSLGLSLGFKSGNDILVLPAGLGGETANWSVAAVWLQLDLAVARWQD